MARRTQRRKKHRTPPRIKTGKRKGQFRKTKRRRKRRLRGLGQLSYKTPQNNPQRKRRRKRTRRRAGAITYETPTSNPPRRRRRRRARARRSYGQANNNNNRIRRTYRRSYGNPPPASAPFGERFMYATQTGLASAGLAYGLEWLLFTAFRAFPQTRGKVFMLDLARFAAAAVSIGLSQQARGPIMRDALQVGVPAIQGYHVMNDIAARMGILTLPAWAALNAVTAASPAAQQRINNDVNNAALNGLGVVTATDTGPGRRMNRGTGVVTMIDSPNSMAGATVVA